MTRYSSGESTDPYHLGQTLVMTCQSFPEKNQHAEKDKWLKCQAKQHGALQTAQSSDKFSRTTLHTRWKWSSGFSSHLHRSYPKTTWLILCCQHFLSPKLILLFFPGQIVVLYSSWFARSPPHLQNVKDLKARIKGTFLINIFFFLKHFFLFKSCFSLFISVLKVLLSWFLSRGLIWGRWSLQNWLDKLGNYNVEHAVLWNVL